MPIWGRLRQELDRASRAAQGAFDEGKIRLELFRARQRADRAAQALGYAVHRARDAGGDLSAEEYARHRDGLVQSEAEIERLERELAEAERQGTRSASPSPSSADA